MILSSGSLGTPGILERSGIGNPTVLRKAGIEPLVDLPGVGEKYQDHNLIMPAYRVTPGTDTHDEINRGDPEAHKLAAEEFVNGKGKYASNFVDVVLKCRPNEKELEELGPAFRKVWDSYFKNAPDKPVICIIVVNRYIRITPLPLRGLSFFSSDVFAAWSVTTPWCLMETGSRCVKLLDIPQVEVLFILNRLHHIMIRNSTQDTFPTKPI